MAMLNVEGVVEAMVAEVKASASSQREQALLLKQAMLHLQAHLELAGIAAAEEQAAEDAKFAQMHVVDASEVELKAEQKKAACAKQERLVAAQLAADAQDVSTT